MSLRVHPTSNFAVQGSAGDAMGVVAYDASDDIFDDYHGLQPPAPPKKVNAVAKADHAILWWGMPNIDTDQVSQYEVKRYRLEQNRKWKLKGTSIIRNVEGKYHYIRNLQPMKVYRFSVIAVNKVGKGAESKKSESILIEPDLPNGWSRLHDNASHRDYYYCPRSGKSSWERPDDKPFFVNYLISRHFTEREMNRMVAMFSEEISLHEHVSKYRLKDFVERLGRPCADVRYLSRLFVELIEGFTPELVGHKEAEQKAGRPLERGDVLYTFQGVMIAMQAIKYRALRVKQNPFYAISEMATSRAKNRDSDQGVRIADWVLTKGVYLTKTRYRGIVSRENSFFAPRDFLVYMKPGKRQYFSAAFNPEEISCIERIFLYLDTEMSGQVTSDEFCRFMTCLSVTCAARGNNSSARGSGSMAPAVNSNANFSVEDDFGLTCIKLFKLLDRSGKGHLVFEDFVLFFVSLPMREVDARKSYLLRGGSCCSLSSVAHVTTNAVPQKNNGISSPKFLERKNLARVSSFDDNVGVLGGAASSFDGMKFKSKYKKGASIISEVNDVEEPGEEPQVMLQGNEFRILDIVATLSELSAFKADAGDLAMIFGELLVSKKEITVWDTNKLAVGDKSTVWFRNAYRGAKIRVKSFFSQEVKEAKEEKEEEGVTVSDEEDAAFNEVQAFDNDDSDGNNKEKHKPTQKKKKKEKKRKSVESNDDDDEHDASFTFFGSAKRDTTATHGPVCFCGCGNPYWVDEEMEHSPSVTS
jgi:hypothetical protein